jgi:hypothetical protein
MAEQLGHHSPTVTLRYYAAAMREEETDLASPISFPTAPSSHPPPVRIQD